MAADVLRLPLADNSVSAYLSMGVVEHFEEGPGQALREAARVLKAGGVALVSVPFFNARRHAIPIVDRSQAKASGLSFHQYFFAREDLDQELSGAGLQPTGVFHGYGVGRTLSDSSIFWRRLLGGNPPIARLLDYVPSLPDRFAHMMFTVAVKP
jgi:SAM-dependent methyltransferase